jgi:formylglycine-generating enzyme
MVALKSLFYFIMRSSLLFISLVFFTCTQKPVDEKTKAKENEPTIIKESGMVWLAGGDFNMGAKTQSSTGDAQPFHTVKVDGFWMDETEVTNDQFATFVNATNYKTLAEQPVNWEEMKKMVPAGTPKPPDEALQPGALVFTPPAGAVMLNDYSQWWAWTIGANWQHPQGPGSSIEGKGNHPVVQIAYEDAVAYATWAGKRLPTEAEYEYAARGGLQQKEFAWGDELNPQGKYLANYFQGAFPYRNTKDDGFVGTAPVKSFPPNPYGLFDITGNVWELCTDWFAVEDFNSKKYSSVIVNPKGPAATFDPNDTYAIKHVSKGGSFLCSNEYCSNYKPSGRQGSSYDTGMDHTGFRCVKDAD